MLSYIQTKWYQLSPANFGLADSRQRIVSNVICPPFTGQLVKGGHIMLATIQLNRNPNGFPINGSPAFSKVSS